MKWINFLHFYQPANADGEVIKEATDKSYRRVVRALEKNPDKKFTLNITGCLFYRWEEFGYTDLIERLKKLIASGQAEIVGTAAYHPILPLIKDDEIIRQIKDNEKILNKFLGNENNQIKPRGFFMPEMAYSEKAAKIIK
jgi:alpha-amylase/alpha-mannosidase (GH57 family)